MTIMHGAQVPKVGRLFTHFVEGRLLFRLPSTRQPQGLKFVIDGGSALTRGEEARTKSTPSCTFTLPPVLRGHAHKTSAIFSGF